MRVAVVQMCSSHQVAENLARAAALIAQAAAQGAELVSLPEYFCLMGQRDADKLQMAEEFCASPAEATSAQHQQQPSTGVLQNFLRTQAMQHGVWLAGGTVPLKTAHADKVSNTMLVFNPQGELAARYDKIHLFAFHKGREAYNEGKVLQAGSQPVVFHLPSRDGHTWRVGLSICYDLRFAELYRQLAADVYLVPSAFTATTGSAHWEVLLRARAIENLAYVAAAAQGGTHSNGRQTWGQSCIINPWGTVLAQRAAQEPGEALVLADCDYAELQHLRTQLPALRHRVL